MANTLNGELAAGQSSPMAAVSPADYAPSPNTCSQALIRANQLRVQALLRQLLAPPGELGHRLNALRVLRRTMRELDHQLSWLTQVDLFETLERLLRNETLDPNSDWRLVHDTSQLIIETLPRSNFEPDAQTMEQIFASAVQNLGHQRSEVRRVSLLLINLQLNERRLSFQRLLRIFIDYGLTNERNKQAQRGAILSLPLLMTEQVVAGQDVGPLIRSLCELLVEAEPQLFYSLYLALQRLHLTLGDQRFMGHLRQCSPDAVSLYKQSASRSGSMEQPNIFAANPQLQQQQQQPRQSSQAEELDTSGAAFPEAQNRSSEADNSKQVTFESVDQAEPAQVLSRAESGASSVSLKPGGGSSYLDELRDETPVVAPAQGLGRPQPEAVSSCASETSSLASGSHRRPTLGGAPNRSSVSSTCSSEANLVDPVHYMNAAALSGNPLADYDQVHHVDHSATGLAINDLCVSCSPTMELGPAAQNELKFGIFPRHLCNAALGARYSDRLEALQEMMCIIRDSPINHLAILMTYFDSFLSQFLARLMEPGTDYKVELIAIDMIETIVIKTKVCSMQYIRPLINLLIKSLGDPRTIFRDNSVRVIHKMMAFLPPQHVIDALFEHKHSKSPLVREESVNRVTAAVLEYDRNEFNLTKLCYHVLPMLADRQASVRLAALECIAALAHALGPDRIGSLLTAAEAVQTGCDYDGFLDAINARIMRRSLPRCQADGSIRYVIKPFLNSSGTTYHQEHQAADVRWVLEAPSQHQHHHQHHQEEEEHHAHRPGAYSPVPAGASNARRGSIPGAALVHGEPSHHHHHHHLQHHNNNGSGGGRNQAANSQQQPPRAARCDPVTELADGAGGLPVGSPSAELAAATQGSGNQSRGAARSGRQASEGQVQPGGIQNNSEIGRRTSRETRMVSEGARGAAADNVAACKQAPPIAKSRRPNGSGAANNIGLRRSNSQDSNSSTDTNKVLFQYYLGKFRQSLEDTPGNMQQSVLPSDSLIYTDVVQAYELSRHQSRHQQTSFDYDIGPVGGGSRGVQVGIERSAEGRDDFGDMTQLGEPRYESPAGERGQTQARRSSLQQQRPDSSGSESPQTVMEQRRPSVNDKQQQQQQVVVDQVSEQKQRRPSRNSSRDEMMPIKQQPEEVSAEQRRRQSRQASDGAPDRRKSSQPQSDTAGQRECDTTGNATTAKQAAQEENQVLGANGERASQRSRGLVRQSASAIAGAEDGEEDDGQPEAAAAPVAAPRRQESNSDSHSSQRDCSDHATQTSRQEADEEGETSPRRSRRRSNRRSSVRREPRQEPAKTGNEDQEDSESDVGRRGAGRKSDDPLEVRRRASRSQPPQARAQLSRASSRGHLMATSGGNEEHKDVRRSVSVSPSAANVNIRLILENVAQSEGPFQEPQLAFRVAMEALSGPCWSTKVEGMLALIRLAAHHQATLLPRLHEVVGRLANETRNLRSTVARSAIFALGDFSARLERAIEPEMETIVQALLQKSIENTAFIRDDIRRALTSMVEHLTQWRLATVLIAHGAGHKNMHVRRMASQFVAMLVDRMGPAKCLVGARDISAKLIPAAAKFAQDSSPHTRHYGRRMLASIMQHSSFERLLRKTLVPNMYRSTIGIVESIKRRGVGDPPLDA